MKIKIEVDGLTLEHATELTKFLSSLQTPNDGERYDKEAFLTQLNYSRDKEGISVEATEKPKQTRKKAGGVDQVIEAEIVGAYEAVKDAKKAIKNAIEEVKKEVEAIEVVEPETVSAPTLMQIRSLVAQKAGEHKDSIKAKLVELGAQNVSTLDAKHFQTIFDFLTEL